jgi:hypothetical protein
MITLGQITEWILKNRRKTAFINYTAETIMDELVRCVNDRTMVLITEPDNSIVGVATGVVNSEISKLYVYNILTTKPKAVKQMVVWFKTNYPNLTLTGKARGVRPRKFNNTNKLLARL